MRSVIAGLNLEIGLGRIGRKRYNGQETGYWPEVLIAQGFGEFALMESWSLQDVSRVAFRLAASYPATDLGNPADPLDDLIYIILSGQTNEALYQSTFQALKTAYPGWRGLARAKLSDIEKIITAGGLARQKAGYIKTIMEQIESEWGEPALKCLRDLPTEEAEKYLANLPGVGIKTARCVLMYTLNREVFPADVNCLRIMERLGWLKWEGRRAELFADTAQDLIPTQLRHTLHVDLVQHGRAVCVPGKPHCNHCCLEDLCSSSGKRRGPGLTVVDLCCGAGGFAWGFMQAGYTYMCLNSVGLAVMGMVGREIILRRATLDQAVAAVARIDWSRDNPLWEGTLRVGPGVARGGNVIELGGSIIKAVGGLPLTDKDIDRLKAVDGLAKKLPPGCLEKASMQEAAVEITPGESEEVVGSGEDEAIEANEFVAAGTRGGE